MEHSENEKFYVGYRELFEKPGRRGYTKLKSEAGKWSLEDAKKMTKYACADGFGRWYIACSALDSYEKGQLNPSSIY